MAAKTTPWWRRAVQFVLKGIRAVARLNPAGRRVYDELAFNELDAYTSLQNEAEEAALIEDSPNTVPEAATSSTPDAAPERAAGAAPEKPLAPAETPRTPQSSAPAQDASPAEAAESQISVDAPPQALADLLAEAALGTVLSAELEPEPVMDPDPPAALADLLAEAVLEPVAEPQVAEPEAETGPDPAREVEVAEVEIENVEVPEIEPHGSETSAAEAPEVEAHEPEAPGIEGREAAAASATIEEPKQIAVPAALGEPELKPADPEPIIDLEADDSEPAEHDPLPGEAIEETLVTTEVESEAIAAESELASGSEAPPEPVADTETSMEQPAEQAAEAPAIEQQSSADAEPEERLPAISAPPAPPAPATAAQGAPQAPAAPPQVVPHEPIRKEQGPDTSPVSILVSQIYEGPFDLLLDLIRKQDIDIYDIPIAKITAQFLTYVNRLKASDMDVAGEFIYTASLLIHIKSKMLLPRNPSGPDDVAEDPRRELVERLLEHERFKNAAQMLQQKQMLEAATWSNPGMRDFREDAGAEPEIAADTVDLVRIFREILERARTRPILNVEEDSVTVGQMIQFLGRRLTMEDKPVALRRLLAHTNSERALIAMFLALLEMVRLQAILLRQDRHFSEIFIKKNSGFDAVMNQGLARDDWQ